MNKASTDLAAPRPMSKDGTYTLVQTIYHGEALRALAAEVSDDLLRGPSEATLLLMEDAFERMLQDRPGFREEEYALYVMSLLLELCEDPEETLQMKLGAARYVVKSAERLPAEFAPIVEEARELLALHGVALEHDSATPLTALLSPQPVVPRHLFADQPEDEKMVTRMETDQVPVATDQNPAPAGTSTIASAGRTVSLPNSVPPEDRVGVQGNLAHLAPDRPAAASQQGMAQYTRQRQHVSAEPRLGATVPNMVWKRRARNGTGKWVDSAMMVLGVVAVVALGLILIGSGVLFSAGGGA